MQPYRAERGHDAVEVFCASVAPRNNVGGWPCRRGETRARTGTFEFYAAKDQAMAAVANVGFMLWDGECVGTLMSVWRLRRGQKSVLVAEAAAEVQAAVPVLRELFQSVWAVALRP